MRRHLLEGAALGELGVCRGDGCGVKCVAALQEELAPWSSCWGNALLFGCSLPVLWLFVRWLSVPWHGQGEDRVLSPLAATGHGRLELGADSSGCCPAICIGCLGSPACKFFFNLAQQQLLFLGCGLLCLEETLRLVFLAQQVGRAENLPW